MTERLIAIINVCECLLSPTSENRTAVENCFQVRPKQLAQIACLLHGLNYKELLVD